MTGTDDAVRHVILLALENRSFDHMLGACQAVKPALDGIPAEGPPRSNQFAGQSYQQLPNAARILVSDPRHETPHVLIQLKSDAAGNPNSGFVEDYATSYPMLNPADRGEVMRYHALGALPALHALAENFMVCDRWFASVPGPTWTNRLFLMTGTSLGRVNMPNGLMDLNAHWYDQPTIFDRLNARSRRWAVYHGDTPLSLLLTHQWEPQNLSCYKPMSRFFIDAADPEEGSFPDFVLIEPAYMDPNANDDHPSHDVLAGEALIASVYNALRANQPLWNSSLLVILFDEHGGFYDHVSPPATLPPDRHQEEYTFDRLGVRVPALLVSPHVASGAFSHELDHTSLLKYLIDKWQLGPLGQRAAEANTFATAVQGPARTDTPLAVSAIPAQLTPVAPPPRQPLNDHQGALVALSHALETMAQEDANVVAMRSRQILTGPQSQIDAAVDRTDAFLARCAAPATGTA
ncbi:MAG: phospholipase [Alphaproteobacteria bacterium]|nr:phospholipase [Alphaproteobacteria bacterium]